MEAFLAACAAEKAKGAAEKAKDGGTAMAEFLGSRRLRRPVSPPPPRDADHHARPSDPRPAATKRVLEREFFDEISSDEAPAAEQPASKGKRAVHRRDAPTQEEAEELNSESVVAAELGIKWRKRGPQGPKDGGPLTWRGQSYRPRSGSDEGGRWANRGGAHKHYWAVFYTATKSGKSKAEAHREAVAQSGDTHYSSRYPQVSTAQSSSGK